jgi:hypothetical protein
MPFASPSKIYRDIGAVFSSKILMKSLQQKLLIPAHYVLEHSKKVCLPFVSILRLSNRRTTQFVQILLKGYPLALLSSRLLYFGLEKLEWSCTAHGGDLSDGGSPSHIHLSRYRWRQFLEMSHTSSVARVESYWANILTNYTRRALTVPSDKLVALSAVAQRFAEGARGGSHLTYLAGIWLEHLPFGLLWYNDNENQSHPTSRTSSWRATSWS